MKKKNYFKGKYYKHVASTGDTLSVILSSSNDGEMAQLIYNGKSYQIENVNQIRPSDDGIYFDVMQNGLVVEGFISYGLFNKPKRNIMSYFRFLPIECKHDIYSLFHTLSGMVSFDGNLIDFNNGVGYIEGDKGRNFPSQYIWINSSKMFDAFTLCIADIPLCNKHILGLTAIIRFGTKEYRFGTYNCGQVISYSEEKIEIKKGSYRFIVEFSNYSGAALKAPINGSLTRTIHECLQTECTYYLYKKDKRLFRGFSIATSLEYVM